MIGGEVKEIKRLVQSDDFWRFNSVEVTKQGHISDFVYDELDRVARCPTEVGHVVETTETLGRWTSI